MMPVLMTVSSPVIYLVENTLHSVLCLSYFCTPYSLIVIKSLWEGSVIHSSSL